MPTQLQRTITTDREFIRSMGIQDDREFCDMCKLLALSEARALETVAESHRVNAGHVETIAGQRQKIRTWQLATFAAVLMMILFACMSVGRAA